MTNCVQESCYPDSLLVNGPKKTSKIKKLSKSKLMSGFGGVGLCKAANLQVCTCMLCVQGKAEGDAGHQEEDQGRAAAC